MRGPSRLLNYGLGVERAGIATSWAENPFRGGGKRTPLGRAGVVNKLTKQAEGPALARPDKARSGREEKRKINGPGGKVMGKNDPRCCYLATRHGKGRATPSYRSQ